MYWRSNSFLELFAIICFVKSNYREADDDVTGREEITISIKILLADVQ